MTDSKEVAVVENLADLIPGAASSPALQIFLNDRLYTRCIDVARRMSEAEGFTPKHLLNKPAACFAVVQMSLIWKLAPPMVAGATYQTPGGQIGYEGKLCQAIIENSGMVEGGVQYEYYGPWEKIEGKFKLVEKTNKFGGKYNVPEATWKPEDEVGVGVRVIIQVKGEAEPRVLPFDLRSAHPRNSTLWPLRPKQQLGYTAVRAAGNVLTPGIFMGVPFDPEDNTGDGMVDVTPTNAQPARPTKPTKRNSTVLQAEDTARQEHVREAARETVVEETVIEATDPKEPVHAKEEPQGQETGEAASDAEVNESESESEADRAEDAGPDPLEEAAPEPVKPVLTEAEIKAFKSMVEKAILNAKDVLAIDKVKSDNNDMFKKLKAAAPEIYAKTAALWKQRSDFLRAKDTAEE